jgi:hypothetical protein
MSTLDTTTETPADIRPGTAIRDPLADHLITPQNSALILIDYQPDQVKAVRSMDQDLLVENIISTVKLAKLFGVPVVHSTVNVATGRQEPTIPRVAELLEDDPPVDRTARATRSIPLSMRSVARPPKPIGPASSVSLGLEASPSAGSRWRASFSAIGPAKRRWLESSRSCSPSAC